ncbi:TolC family protein [Lentisphaerota bacterium ZTH]|nr:TolC family protein [Lentisphaerota bacterium]WET06500.1 TolC family protein [Lentisphaerota bacterium ZTH]
MLSKFPIENLRKIILSVMVLPFTVPIIFAGGCYSYAPAQVSTEADTFVQRKKGRADKTLEGVNILSLKKAQEVAVINNPNYSSIYHAVNAAKMRYYQALGGYSPTITANFSVENDIDNYKGRVNYPDSSNPRTNALSTSTGLTANWLIFDGLARTMNVLATRYSFKAEKSLLEDTRRLLMLSVATSYYSILLAIEQQRIARANMEFQLANLRDTQLKYKAGAVPLSEVLNFKIEVNVATGDQIIAEFNYENNVYALARLMGYPEGNLPPHVKFPSVSSDTDDELTSVDVYLDTALNNRPDLRRFRELLQAAKYTMYQSYGTFFPTVNAFGTLSYNTNLTRYGAGSSISHSYYNNPSFDYGVSASWLVFDGLARFNRVRETEALVAQAKFNVAEAWLIVIENVRSSYINYVQNLKQARIYKKTLGLVTKQRDLVEEEYRAGNTELARLNQAQNQLVSAETNLVTALVNTKIAKAQLDAATNTNIIGLDLSNKTQ